ncbi:hypothetical protein BK126_26355 [Paenibacillus sp. FSL H7-0326]|nr:hypothetical protein BK126_26355 [Paenibacillus sp. FSL H7-0326]
MKFFTKNLSLFLAISIICLIVFNFLLFTGYINAELSILMIVLILIPLSISLVLNLYGFKTHRKLRASKADTKLRRRN